MQNEGWIKVWKEMIVIPKVQRMQCYNSQHLNALSGNGWWMELTSLELSYLSLYNTYALP